MKTQDFKILLIQLKEDGENNDYPHEQLANLALEAVEELGRGRLTDIQRDGAVQAWIDGFCQAETAEKKVYVLNVTTESQFRDWETKGEYNKIMDRAEDLGTVYSLQGFQDALNDEQLNLDNSFIYITDNK